jgi:hypothetical protein
MDIEKVDGEDRDLVHDTAGKLSPDGAVVIGAVMIVAYQEPSDETNSTGYGYVPDSIMPPHVLRGLMRMALDMAEDNDAP